MKIAAQMIGLKIDEVKEIMMNVDNHESLVYWRGVIAGLEYAKKELEKDED